MRSPLSSLIALRMNLRSKCLSTMNFGFLGNNIPWFKSQLKTDRAAISISTKDFIEQPKQNADQVVKLHGWPFAFLSFLPWANNAGDQFERPSTINRQLRRQAQTRRNVDKGSEVTSLRFRPYVCKVPWHTGARAFFSQLFPRYGHYCGPNWSSGKDHGSLVWDKRPIDWLDFCCYCHDIGYDTHDQAKLLKADLAFLECLEKQHMSTKGDPRVALLCKTMCINVQTAIDSVWMAKQFEMEKLEPAENMMVDQWRQAVSGSSSLLQIGLI